MSLHTLKTIHTYTKKIDQQLLTLDGMHKHTPVAHSRGTATEKPVGKGGVLKSKREKERVRPAM